MTIISRQFDIAIIGAGASGLAAAIEAKRMQPSPSVAILEKSARPGRKILASGNGRCNIANENLMTAFYHGENPAFTEPAFSRYPLAETKNFFAQMGIPLRQDGRDGRLYPYSLSSAAVIDALRLEATYLGIEILTDAEAVAITRSKQVFFVEFISDGVRKKMASASVIVACGGAASPGLGGCMDGYALLKKLGHRITALKPSIVQLESDSAFTKSMDGLRIDAVAAIKNSAVSCRDEVLFTKYGLSGPAIMQISYHCVSALSGGNKPVIALNLLPDFSPESLINELSQRVASRPWVLLEDFLVGLLPKRIGMMAVKAAEVAPFSRFAESLTRSEIKAIANTLQNWEFNITGDMGMKQAQVTSGGAATGEFDSATMQSKLVQRLFACGEVLDIDGDCGGYNLQWAWSSGRLAGFHAANSARNKQQKGE